MFSNQFEPLLI